MALFYSISESQHLYQERLNMYIFIFVLLLSFSFRCEGQSAHFDIEKISSRVYVATPKKSVRVDATSTIIVSKNFITVVDAQSNEASSKVLIDQIKKEISAKPIKYLVLTHPHIDNSVGASAFRSDNSQVSIISHPWTRGRMKQLPKSVSGHINHITQLSKSLESSMIDAEQQRYTQLLDFKRDLTESNIILPDITVSDTLIINDEDFMIKVFHLGHGHTQGDLLVHVPEERLVITGDLVHDLDPLYFGDSNPDEWIAILRKIEKLPFDFLVGARGKAQHNKEVLVSFMNYIEELTTNVKNEQASGNSKKNFIKSFSASSLNSLSASGYGTRILAMREKFQDTIWNLSLDEMVKNHVSQIWDCYKTNLD